MIAAEMRSFNPGNYLAYLPYPKVTYTPAVQVNTTIDQFVPIVYSIPCSICCNSRNFPCLVLPCLTSPCTGSPLGCFHFFHFLTQEEMARLETAASSSGSKSAPSSSARLNMDRYGVQAPSGKKEEKDEQVKLKKTQRKRRRKNIFALLFFFNFLYVF
jgi:hypothetical protein